MLLTLTGAIDNQSGDPVGTSYSPTTTTALDSRNLRLDRGRADFDQTHVLTTTWIYELPFGKGKTFLNSAPGLVQAVLGGWSVQGFNSIMSGEPFSISSGAKTANYSTSTNSRAALAGATLPSDSLHAKAGATGPVFPLHHAAQRRTGCAQCFRGGLHSHHFACVAKFQRDTQCERCVHLKRNPRASRGLEAGHLNGHGVAANGDRRKCEKARAVSDLFLSDAGRVVGCANNCSGDHCAGVVVDSSGQGRGGCLSLAKQSRERKRGVNTPLHAR